MVHPSDERSHQPGSQRSWEESWAINFAAADGRLGGFVRLTLRPGQRTAWWWAYVVRRGEPVVVVREHEVDPPRTGSMEIRASGLWADLVCEEPLDHWSIGMEAFAVALDHPADAYEGERGQPVPAGFDLEWEASELAAGRLGGVGYDQGGVVHGDVLIGSERIAVDAIGSRSHDWGDNPWWSGGERGRASYRLDDGRWYHLRLAQAVVDGGTLRRAGTTDGAEMTPLLAAAVAIPGPAGEMTRMAGALCRVEAPGGEAGLGWAEWVQPPTASPGRSPA